jgi:hypothetical protein
MNDDAHGIYIRHTEGELACAADLACAEIIVDEVFVCERGAAALGALRLCYWLSWYERTGMWLSPRERANFIAVFESARADCDIPERVFARVRAIANNDGGDVCASAHSRS